MTGAMNGDGLLRRALEEARCETGCSRDDLTVLSPQIDPYRFDTPAGHRNGAWLAEQLDRAVGDTRRIHWRGLHYLIVAAADIRKPDGEIYRNTDEDWKWLSGAAGKAARWLGYIDFERIIDNRNSEPAIHRKARVAPETWISVGLNVTVPDIEELDPHPEVIGFEGRQPYGLTIFGEKTSLEEVLLPLAERFEADLYLPAGEISDTLLFRMAKDGHEDERPMVVFVIADFDPAGHQMAVSIGRKLQALRDLRFHDLEFEVVPVALTVEQVRELRLPSTPLKKTEKRASKWRSEFGVEQTEIDALATLRQSDFEEIVVDAISPFHDFSLANRVAKARAEWMAAAERSLEEQTDGEALDGIREQAVDRLADLEAEIEIIKQQLWLESADHVSLPEAEIPTADIDEELARQSLLSFVRMVLGRGDTSS